MTVRLVIGGTFEQAAHYATRVGYYPNPELVVMSIEDTFKLRGLDPDVIYFTGTAQDSQHFLRVWDEVKIVWLKGHKPRLVECGHCGAAFYEQIGLRQDVCQGKRVDFQSKHVCPDGHVEDRFMVYLPITDADMEAFATTARKVLKDTG